MANHGMTLLHIPPIYIRACHSHVIIAFAISQIFPVPNLKLLADCNGQWMQKGIENQLWRVNIGPLQLIRVILVTTKCVAS